ncbi:chemotaxis protein CheA [bacterium]|nr:chemotaxis protein CheA [bacterium]
MTITDVQSQLEDVAQSLVMLDRSCALAEMASVRDRLDDLAHGLRDLGHEAEATAAENAAAIAATCVAEHRFSEVVIDNLNRAIDGLQECFVEDGPPPRATAPSGPDPAPAPDPASDEPQATVDAEEAADAAAVPDGLKLSDFVEDGIVSEFLGRQSDSIADVQNMVLGFEGGATDGQVDELKRWFHTLKGEAGLLGLQLLADLCHAAEDMLQAENPAACADRLFEVFDWMLSCFDYLSEKGPVPGPTDDLVARLRTPATTAPAATESEAASTDAADPDCVDHPGAPGDPTSPEPVQDVVVEAPNDPVDDEVIDELAPDAAPDPAPADEPAVDEVADEAVSAPADEPSVELPPVELPDYTGKNLLSFDVGLLQDFIGEANEHLEASEGHLLTIEADPHETDALNAVFRGFHTIKGLAGFAELDAIQELAHKAENLLDMGRKGEVELTGVNMDLVFESVDTMKRLVEGVTRALATTGHQAEVPELPNLVARLILATSGQPVPTAPTQAPAPEPSDEAAPAPATGAADDAPSPVGKSGFVPLGNMKTKQPAGGDDGTAAVGKSGFVPLSNMNKKAESPPPAPAATVEPAPAASVTPAAVPTGAVKVKEAVRVDAERLDRLIETIGEMVIAESMVSQNPEMRQNMSVKLARDLDHLDKISRELQEIGMSLRMVPVRPVFQKMARLVRDLAKKTDRKVEFVMSGEDTELDKNVVDKIGDPLVHMVRNAVDHGLEPTVEERRAAGKPDTGHVELRAYHKGGNICIEIVDDGRGLPRDKILKKAIERGLVKEGDQLSDREINNLIFEPGFSTAKQVTDISGRGVGMDVVRRNIEELRGTCEINSEPGKGSTFSIKLPLTLAIIEGMVVSCGPEHYIVPTLSVVRLVRPTSDDISRVFDRGEMLAHEDEHLPLFRLGQLFDIETAKTDPEEAVVVVVEDENKKVGLLADDLLGQQSIVIKSLGESMQDTEGVAGGAIMSNGHVALILDVAGLIKLAHNTDTSAIEPMVEVPEADA